MALKSTQTKLSANKTACGVQILRTLSVLNISTSGRTLPGPNQTPNDLLGKAAFEVANNQGEVAKKRKDRY